MVTGELKCIDSFAANTLQFTRLFYEKHSNATNLKKICRPDSALRIFGEGQIFLQYPIGYEASPDWSAQKV
jgi:hypothetical protein